MGVAGGHTCQSIATGRAQSCGVDLTGNVYCWGLNDTGQLGDATTTQRNSPVMVSNPALFSGGWVFRAGPRCENHSCPLVDASAGDQPSAVSLWGNCGRGHAVAAGARGVGGRRGAGGLGVVSGGTDTHLVRVDLTRLG